MRRNADLGEGLGDSLGEGLGELGLDSIGHLRLYRVDYMRLHRLCQTRLQTRDLISNEARHLTGRSTWSTGYGECTKCYHKNCLSPPGD
ncbi:hypothetical protein Taro_019263 [Colocasia esculenta]|uniref:Uncharacterized protein n=1 Tax=Colocasia esculenta TaxID=4460 RepID=A0A843UW86_COLES|nr:hypothetical protein [Colocasia esculenta]